MKIIDAHCHLHKKEWYNEPRSDFLIEHFNEDSDENLILANMAEASIEKTIIFPLSTILIDLETANRYVVSISRKYPGKFIPFTVIDEKPHHWATQGVQGFKEHTYGQRIQKDAAGNDIFSRKFKETYKYMETNRFPLLLHAGVNRVERLKEDIFKDTPNLIVILAHLGADFPQSNNHNPYPEQVRSTLEELKDIPNLFYDIAAVINPEILSDALRIVGSEKLIFGSDFPYEPPLQTLNRLRALPGITARDMENILYNTITGILNSREGA